MLFVVMWSQLVN